MAVTQVNSLHATQSQLKPLTLCSSVAPSRSLISPKVQTAGNQNGNNNVASMSYMRSTSTPNLVPVTEEAASMRGYAAATETHQTTQSNNDRFDDKGSHVPSARLTSTSNQQQQRYEGTQTMILQEENTAKITPTANRRAGKIIHKERKASSHHHNAPQLLVQAPD